MESLCEYSDGSHFTLENVCGLKQVNAQQPKVCAHLNSDFPSRNKEYQQHTLCYSFVGGWFRRGGHLLQETLVEKLALWWNSTVK